MLDRASLRVLIVDDQQSMRMLITAALRSLGIVGAATAEDGVEALKMLEKRRFDLVLLDAEMPRLSGLEALAAIRRRPEFAALPVIMVTGRADEHFVRTALQQGISGYVVKPVSATTLGARIDAAIAQANAAEKHAL